MSGCPECGRRFRWRWWVVALGALVTVILLTELAGCGSRVVTIGALEPTPRIELPKQSTHLALDLGRTPDVLRVDADSFVSIELRELRLTLTNGFERGLGRVFVTTRGVPAEQTLVVDVTGLAFVSSPDDTAASTARGAGNAEIVLVHGGPHASHAKAPARRRYARLAFTARLRDGTTEVAHISGFVHSADAAESNRASLSRAIASAVVELYEEIGRELFVRRTARREANRR